MQIVILIFGCIGIFLLIVLSVGIANLLYGKCGANAAKELTTSEKNMIRQKGIYHNTTKKNRDRIQNSQVVLASGWFKSYSTQGKHAAFFYICGMKSKTRYDRKHSERIVIKKLTDQQIEKMKIRDCDKAIMYLGDFHILEDNQYYWTKNE